MTPGWIEQLTPSEARAVEAVIKAGCGKGAARDLGVEVCTLRSQLEAARQKAGVKTTLLLVVDYLKAKTERLQ